MKHIETYLGIMWLERMIHERERWFIHFNFDTTYDPVKENRYWVKDYWKAFWDLPNVRYDDILTGEWQKPKFWPFIQVIDGLRVERLHFGKWTTSSPYFRDGIWVRYRLDI